ncbi:MAG: HEAT repeat domain-containing protein, partial [Euryarchaeota archaeon]|nr:HEAT repeat domain-containing protein [Euryarchaeota archaeon]
MQRSEDEKNPYKPFQADNVEPKYARDRGFAVLHTELDVTLDDRAKEVRGAATLTVRAIHDLKQVEFDAADMKILGVKVDGKVANFDHDEPSLVVSLPRTLKENAQAKVEIRYDGKPSKGLYFITPDKHYPKKPVQIWSQGESEDNHHWFPGYDYPNNKATSEARLTVRKPLTAFSNGHLVGTQAKGPWTTFHWKQDVAQPNYLIAVVVGEFDEVKDEWDGVPLHHFVPKGQKEWAKETFKNTANVLGFFSKATGYRYPYAKYAQAVIADFMWGGMENTSMTTVNEKFLILPKHRDDADPDGLIAHEAAHQWFGDLVTTKSWDHIWLNEGFATYFDALWHESFHGKDLFQLELLENADAYFAEDRESYRRPIVTKVYAENEDLFDRHTYQKGSLVLHMLRNELGDDLWWKSIRHYLKKFEWKNVETADFKIAIEEATGRNLDWFFDQWIFRAGHPELEARWEYDEKTKLVKINVKQTQKVVADTPLFRLPLTVWTWNGKDDRKEHTFTVRKADESFYFPSPKKPVLVQLDPHGAALKRLSFEKGAKEWAFQLDHAPDVSARIEACRALGKKASDGNATEALRRALTRDKFWGVRRAAATALGEQATIAARDALASGARDPHPRVRRGVARALGNFKHDAKAANVLARILRAEKKSDYVVAAALFGLAQTKHSSALATLKRHLSRPSHNEIIRTSVFAALGELKDPKALPLVIAHTRYGTHAFVRGAATICLGRLWEFVDKRQQED